MLMYKYACIYVQNHTHTYLSAFKYLLEYEKPVDYWKSIIDNYLHAKAYTYAYTYMCVFACLHILRSNVYYCENTSILISKCTYTYVQNQTHTNLYAFTLMLRLLGIHRWQLYTCESTHVCVYICANTCPTFFTLTCLFVQTHASECTNRHPHICKNSHVQLFI